jgi:hypothetical protein
MPNQSQWYQAIMVRMIVSVWFKQGVVGQSYLTHNSMREQATHWGHSIVIIMEHGVTILL